MNANNRKLRTIFGCVGLFFLLCFAILLTMWPWPRYFVSGFPDHWDPPFHAWKLQWLGSQFFEGRLLPHGFNTNTLYPNGYTLYYEALHWPQAILAGAVYAVTGNPVLAYNLTFLVFWAFSGVCMCLFLREGIGLKVWSSILGAALFCLMPYRTSYYVEFNMQLCFAIPLFLLFLLRFLRCPNVGNAAGLALSFWLQAVSELYQALILFLAIPFLSTAFIIPWWRQWARNLRFYRATFLGLFLAAGLSLCFLSPYYTLSRQGFRRTPEEMKMHCLEPLSYLAKGEHHGKVLGLFLVKEDEMTVYLTFSVLGMASVYGLLRRRERRHGHECRSPVRLKMERLLRNVRAACAVLFLATLIAIFMIGFKNNVMQNVWSFLLNCELLSILLISWVVPLFMFEERLERLMIAALGCAAVFGFIMSFGPSISVGRTQDIGPWRDIGPNVCFYLVNAVTPLLSGMRVVSRFSILVLLFVVTAAASGFEAMMTRLKPAWRFLVVPWFALLLIEAKLPSPRYKDADYPLKSQAVDTLRKLEPPVCAIVLPMGDRNYDSQYMLKIARNDMLLVNGWSGFVPYITKQLLASIRTNDLNTTLIILRMIWPEPYVIVDKPTLAHYVNQGKTVAEAITANADLLSEDNRFAVYSIHVATNTAVRYGKLIRGDLLEENPVIHFEARLAEQGVEKDDLLIAVNGHVVGKTEISKTLQRYRFIVPRPSIQYITPNRIRLWTGNNLTMNISGFSFSKPSGKDIKPEIVIPPSTDSAVQISNTVSSLPTNVARAPIHFANNMEFCGVQVEKEIVHPGESIRIRYYWKWPSRFVYGNNMNVGVFVHFLRGHKIVTQDDHAFSRDDFHTLLLRLDEELVMEENTVTFPETAPPGEYHIQMGLLESTGKQRIHMSTSFPQHDHAADLPLIIRVIPREAYPVR